jgi:hypothetical protein
MALYACLTVPDRNHEVLCRVAWICSPSDVFVVVASVLGAFVKLRKETNFVMSVRT